MARDFDGAGDNISFGSDASIDDLNPITIGMWFVRDVLDASDLLLAKSASAAPGWELFVLNNASGNYVRFRRFFSGGTATWRTSGTVAAGALTHLVLVYDSSSATNDPVIYLNGTLQTFFEDTNSSGTATSEASYSLRAGEDTAGFSDLDGRIQNLVYDAASYSAADANRMRWWGTRGGSPLVYHPMITGSLTNKGSGTADGTATGTTMASLPRVMRPGCGGW